MAAPVLTFKPLVMKAGRKTKAWFVTSTSNGNPLGVIAWYTHWRRYVFYPHPSNLFDAECLGLLAGFCQDETHKRQLERQAERDATKVG